MTLSKRCTPARTAGRIAGDLLRLVAAVARSHAQLAAENALSMPGNNGLRFHNDERHSPVGPRSNGHAQRHRSTFARWSRGGRDLRITCSWWRNARISRCRATRDRTAPRSIARTGISTAAIATRAYRSPQARSAAPTRTACSQPHGPSVRAFAASGRRWSSVKRQAPGSDVFTQDAVLFQEIINDVTLRQVEPAGRRDHNERQGCDSDGTAASLADAELLGASDRPSRRRSGYWTVRDGAPGGDQAIENARRHAAR
jgi:hypothetical protein